jgi:16S rRNA C967 or C1407 C5-methylase (RsmB/RsmF family)/NOL1/NOP2/fmu family ribosome biogenesis protein
MTAFPPPFVRQMQQHLGDEYATFEAALRQDAPVSVRFNAHKVLRGDTSLPLGDRVAWHPQGFYLSARPVFTLDPAFHAGAYYVQEASSMFLYEALRQTADLSKPLRVLDLCAAPGGKSTLLLDALPPDALLVANEVIRSRINPLRDNVTKWGCSNTAVGSAEAEHFAAIPDFFDVIVADAPCSGEGMFRKDPDAIREWSPDHVQHCALRQRRILAAAVEALAPGGLLIFSTCTFNRVENTDNAKWLTQNFDLQRVALTLNPAWGVTEIEGGYHFFPHRTRGEGFYLAMFRKGDGVVPKRQYPTAYKLLKPLPKAKIPDLTPWVKDVADWRFFLTPQEEIVAYRTQFEPDFLLLDKALPVKWFGCAIGAFKGCDFIPTHSLALGDALHEDLPRVDLDKEQALLYLKREPFSMESTQQGWTLATYQGLPLGWMKVLPNRVNNYLPAEWRIRMDLR